MNTYVKLYVCFKEKGDFFTEEDCIQVDTNSDPKLQQLWKLHESPFWDYKTNSFEVESFYTIQLDHGFWVRINVKKVILNRIPKKYLNSPEVIEVLSSVVWLRQIEGPKIPSLIPLSIAEILFLFGDFTKPK